MDSLLSGGVRQGRPQEAAVPAVELLPAEPATAGLFPAEATGADLTRTGELEPDATAVAELDVAEIEPAEAPSSDGVLPGQLAPDQGELEDLDPDPTLSGRLIPIGLLSAGGQLALAGTAPDLPRIRAATAPSGSAWLANAGRVAQDWASRRSFGLSSACGVSVAMAVCAASWFSAGTRTDLFRGVGALWAGYLVLKAGQMISAPPPPPLSRPRLSHQRRRGQESGGLAAPAELDIAAPVILEPGREPWPRPQQPSGRLRQPSGGLRQPSGEQRQPSGEQRQPSAGQHGRPAGTARLDALRRPAGAAGWLAALGSCLAECVVYAGLAAGAAAERWNEAWPFAIAVLGLVAVRNLMTVCSTLPGFGDHPEGAFRRLCAAVLTMPAGGRILLVGIVAPLWGARAALLVLLEWAIISIAYGLAGRVAVGALEHDGDLSPGKTSLLLRLRDDGALARALGALVRGSLLPLPPAVLGLVAISTLAVLGLHGLPWVLMIGPAVVMLLAAPGSAHPHTGRFDWLVPSLLLGAQILYLTAIGFAARVPGPVTFVLVVAVLMRYTDLAFPGRPVMLAKSTQLGGRRGERGTALGWEGRLLLAGLAAAMGIATFAYLALTAYLGVLICARVVVSSLAPQEEDRS
jgi:hypothetical protein